MNGHVAGHVDYIHFDRATYSHMTRTSSVVTFCLNVAVYTNLIQWIWAKGIPANPRLPNRYAGPCKLLFVAMVFILVENAQAVCYVIGLDIAPRYAALVDEQGNSYRTRTSAYWTVVFTSYVGMLSACGAFMWYYSLTKYYATRDRLLACGDLENAANDACGVGECADGGAGGKSVGAAPGTCTYERGVRV
mmetsp:Transcript_24476/g.61555  ORF Transcript_24476/g.61555 Transcript_24476/m.61555 type:complete len:191 (+) Transcript_24476:483-1055(+)|eukprot:g17469.t1